MTYETSRLILMIALALWLGGAIGAIIWGGCAAIRQLAQQAVATPVTIYACQLLMDTGYALDDRCCEVAFDGKPPGAWCGSCWWLRKELA